MYLLKNYINFAELIDKKINIFFKNQPIEPYSQGNNNT